jgi:hypothetical protein
MRPDDNGIELTSEAVDSRTGQLTRSRYKAKLRWQGLPCERRSSCVDSIALQRIDARTLKATTKKAGRIISQFTAIVSPDRRAIMVTYIETDTQGSIYKGSEVYEKQ